MPRIRKVMFLGDSTTLGLTHAVDSETAMGGYRGTYLTRSWAQYNAPNGSNNPTSVGSQLSAVATWGYHEGHGGYRIADIQTNVEGWIAAHPAHAILLWIGINDYIQGMAAATAAANTVTLIGTIRTCAPKALVLVGTLIAPDPSQGWGAGGPAWVADFNAAIKAAYPMDPAAMVRVVDVGPTVPYDQLYDGLHPNDAGYATVGNAWFDLGGDFMAERALLQHETKTSSGRSLTGQTVTVYEDDGATLLTQTMYDAASGGNVLSNPLVSNANGYVEAYVDRAQSCVVGWSAGTARAYFEPAPEDRVTASLSDKGDVLLSGSAAFGSDTLRKRNRLPNGDARVQTRVTLPVTDNSKCLDAMRLLMESASGWIVSQETSDVPVGGSPTAYKFTVGATNNVKGGGFFPIQRSDVFDLRGEVVSLQGKLKISDARVGDIRMGLAAFAGTADSGVAADPVSSWGAAGTNPTLGTNWSFVNTPVNLGVTTSYLTYEIENLLVPETANNLALILWCDDKTTTAADYFLATDLQVEKGAICTAYDRVPIADQEARCGYYVRSFGGGSFVSTGSTGQILNTGALAEITVTLGTGMRALPTIEVVATDWALQPYTGPVACTTITIQYGNRKSVTLRAATGAGGLTGLDGQTVFLYSNTGTTSVMVMTAEL